LRAKPASELAPGVVEPVLLRSRREGGEHRIGTGAETVLAKQRRRDGVCSGRDVQSRQESAAVETQVLREMQVFGRDACPVAVARDDLGDQTCAALACT